MPVTLAHLVQYDARTAQQAKVQENALEERCARLMRLRFELTRNEIRVRVRKPRNGRWKLTVRSIKGNRLTIMCAGAEGIYVYVTGDGRLLGRTEDVRHVARVIG